MVLLAALAAASWGARCDVADGELEYMVRRLGYGAGIHAFKNFLLRGRAEYASQARAAFTEVLHRLDAIDRAGSADGGEETALAELRRVVLAHRDAIDRIAALREKGWRIADIDRSVAVDVAPARAALERLRAGRSWSELAEIEYQLGFGRAIHHFKDFVLRGRVEDEEQARTALRAAELAAKTVIHRAALGVSELQRFRIVANTAAAYRTRLELVGRLHAEGRPVREVDLAVKINDGPAVRALLDLRVDGDG